MATPSPQSSRRAKSGEFDKLYRWQWSGRNNQGKRVRGVVVATQRGDVERELSGQDIFINNIRRKNSLLGNGTGSIKPRDIMLFARQMATMIRAGVPVLQAFAVVTESLMNPAMRRLVGRLAQDVSSGSSFSEALRQHPRYFDQLFSSMVAAGEQSGSLDRMLERVASYKEKVESLKARVRKALYYPIAVIIVGISVTTLLLIKVVPQFENLFHSFDAELPILTRMTISLADFLQQYWLWGVLLFCASALLLMRGIKRSATFSYHMQRLTLRIPVIGDILDRSAVARFAQTLSTTYSAGVPLVESLNTASGAAGSKVYERAILQVQESVSNGQQLHLAMRNTGLFPPLAVQMVGIGEEAGSLDTMLNRLADFYEEEVDNKVEALTSLLEPFIIVVLGLLVGGLVVSMYLPIFELGTAI